MDLTVRTARDEDLLPLTELYNHYIENTAITFDLEPYTVSGRQLWFDQFKESERYRLLIAEKAGNVVGYACSGRFHPKEAYQTSVETSIYLHPAVVQGGIGTELYRHLFEELSHIDVHRAYAGITVPNDASFRLHQKFGFKVAAVYREVGRKFGVYHDVHWMEKEL